MCHTAVGRMGLVMSFMPCRICDCVVGSVNLLFFVSHALCDCLAGSVNLLFFVPHAVCACVLLKETIQKWDHRMIMDRWKHIEGGLDSLIQVSSRCHPSHRR